MNASDSLQPQLSRYGRLALIVGVVGLLISIVLAVFGRAQFFQSYLYSWLFWVGISLGCLAVLMCHHLMGGQFGFATRRILEAGAWTVIPMGILFVPILLGLPDLYRWAGPASEIAKDPVLVHKAPYLNVPFFVLRTVLFFVVWGLIASALSRYSAQQDRAEDPASIADFDMRMRRVSRVGLVTYVLFMTLASFDWSMSLQPEWYSTIYGFLYITAQLLSGMAFLNLVSAFLSARKPFSDLLKPGIFNDMGNLLLATVMLWAYMSFSQLLIVWSGNLPEEITWYINRTEGGWLIVGLIFVLFQFALPFVGLLSGRNKRNKQFLATIAALLLFVRLGNEFWLVMPAFYPGRYHVALTDFVLPVALGGLWLAAFLWQFSSKPLIPQHEPHLLEAMELKHG